MTSPVTSDAAIRSDLRQAFASDGTPFYPELDIWSFRTLSGAVNIDFTLVKYHVSSEFLASFKQVVQIKLTTGNINTAGAAFRQFRDLAITARQRRDAPISEIDAEDVAAWCARGRAAYVGQLRIITDLWDLLNLPGIKSEAYEFIKQVFFPQKKDKSAVSSWDPNEGAYRPAEDAALKAALDAGFNDGRVDLYEYALARIFRGLGMRSAQLSAMKVCDLRRKGDYVDIRIPLLKQRGVPERGAFMPWKPITQGLAEVLFLHIETNVLPRVPSGCDPAFAQLFPPRHKEFGVSEGVKKHQAKDSIVKTFTRVFDRLAVVSPITGCLMVVHPMRERHTVLTGLAMNGCNSLEIAANAGHAMPESCQAYVDASIDHFQRMERLVGEAFIPIADRFLGKIVREAKDQEALKRPNSVLRDKEMNGVGSCHIGGCGAVDAGVAPVACYTCRKFRAWAEGPHEAMLEALIARQTELMEAGHSEMAETMTAPIVAITDLLEAIESRERANG